MTKSKPKENNSSIDIYDDDIEYYFLEYCQKYSFNPFKISYRQWTGGLMYIYNHAFKNKNTLFQKNSIHIQKQYDLDIVNALCDRYIYLCNLYSKEISIYGFSVLSGIDLSVIYTWKNNTYRQYEYYNLQGEKISYNDTVNMKDGTYYKRLSNTAKKIYEKLLLSSKQSIRDGAGSVGVGPLALFNDMVSKDLLSDSRVGQIQDYSKTDVIDRLGIANELQSLPDLQTENR